MIQYESTHPRAPIALWSTSAYDGGGLLSDRVMVWWLEGDRTMGEK